MSKTKNTKTATPAVVSEPVVVKVEAAPKVEAVAVEKKATKKATKKTAETPVVVAPVLSEEELAILESANNSPSIQIESTLVEQSTDFFAKLQQLSSVISSLKAEYRSLEKRWTKELKNSAKNSNKKRKRAANRAPSGFVKPTQISDELATFLEKPTGIEMARTEVTRDINSYIRTHNLQDKTNGRKINPDARLANLLKINSGEELTYFNLQKYMSRHFSKTAKPVAAATASA